MLQVVQTLKRVVLDLQIELETDLVMVCGGLTVLRELTLMSSFLSCFKPRKVPGTILAMLFRLKSKWYKLTKDNKSLLSKLYNFANGQSALVALKTNLDQIRRQVQVLQVLESFQSNCGELVDEVFGQVESLEGVSSLEDVTVESGQSVVRQFEGFQPI
jgi:hypothetical protein